jgi:ankyrin repeat protein
MIMKHTAPRFDNSATRSRRRRRTPLLAVLVATVAALALPSEPARAHETDQFSVPIGKQFADLSDYISNIAYDALTEGVEKTNSKIQKALARNASADELAELHGPDVIANDVYTSFPNAVVLIEDIENYVGRPAIQRKYPGRIVGYQEFSYIYDHNFFPLDPRQVFKIWRASTIKVNGVYLGTDKIGHFTDMGMNFYKRYRAALKEGKSDEEARAAVIDFGTNDAILGERGLIGLVSSGVYSNADLASNWAGMKFYMNLTQPAIVGGEMREPMLVRDGEFWALAPYATKDSDFVLAFITEHFDEVLNPSLHTKGMRDSVTKAIEKRAGIVLAWYADANGMQRAPEYFDERMEELRTYYGEDYGWWDDDGAIITVSKVCYPPLETQLAKGANGAAPLMQAAERGDPASLRAALREGSDANAQLRPTSPFSTEAGNRPLHLAARRGALDAVSLLLEAGADAKSTNIRNVTPLHMAAHHPDAAERLIEAGASVTATDVTGRSPLHWASNNPSEPVAKLLVERGADVNQADNNGLTPLHLAARSGEIAVITSLLDGGADVGAKARYDTTPLHMAAAHDQADAVALLIERGADVNAKDEYGCTPLHDAARVGHVDTVQSLLSGGADANAKDAYGTTPMHLAARFDRPTTVTLLLKAGADPGAGNDFGVSPVEEARRKRNTIISNVFAEWSSKQ